ncbi:hypothetical protein B566_EDAN009314 [Ephemera danica]|nr:hypothetical protein B566_EDAN009314 [Ephemera danica]
MAIAVKLYWFVCQAVSVLVSSYTILAISLERYAAIMRPLRPRLARRHARLVIAAVWVAALATAAPILIVSRLVQPSSHHEECDLYQCTEVWSSIDAQKYYSFALLALQYALPLSILIFTHSRIAFEVWGRQAPGEAHNSRDRRMARNKRKMVKMMVVVVIVYTTCWAPLNVLLISLDYHPGLSSWPGLPYAWFAAHWLAMSHSCYNPLVYCWMNARFRAAFAQTLAKVPGVKRCIPPPGPTEPLGRANTCTSYISVRSSRTLSRDCTELYSLQRPISTCKTLHEEQEL